MCNFNVHVFLEINLKDKNNVQYTNAEVALGVHGKKFKFWSFI